MVLKMSEFELRILQWRAAICIITDSSNHKFIINEKLIFIKSNFIYAEDGAYDISSPDQIAL